MIIHKARIFLNLDGENMEIDGETKSNNNTNLNEAKVELSRLFSKNINEYKLMEQPNSSENKNINEKLNNLNEELLSLESLDKKRWWRKRKTNNIQNKQEKGLDTGLQSNIKKKYRSLF